MEHVITDARTGEVTIVPFTDEEIAAINAATLENQWNSLREERDSRLYASDVYVLADRLAQYSPAVQQAWFDYRKALRDLPENTSDPFNPVWPQKPF